MKLRMSIPILGLLTLLLLAVNVSAQSVTSVRFETQDFEDQNTVRGHMHFRDDVLRIDGEEGSQSGSYSLIYRADRDLLWFLQHSERKYIEMDKETLAEMSSQISGMMAQIQEQLKNLPPEQRAAMERMMKGRLPEMDQAETESTPPEIRATGESEEISGYPCRRYDVYQDGAKMAEVWATSRSNVPGAGNLSAVFDRLAEFYKSMTSSFAQFQKGFDFNVMAELEGFPIRMRNYEDGQLRSEMRIDDVQESSGSPDLFELPAGYDRQQMNFPR